VDARTSVEEAPESAKRLWGGIDTDASTRWSACLVGVFDGTIIEWSLGQAAGGVPGKVHGMTRDGGERSGSGTVAVITVGDDGSDSGTVAAIVVGNMGPGQHGMGSGASGLMGMNVP
jgi:hypothetical protein